MTTQPPMLSVETLAQLLREAEQAHGAYERQLGRRDDDWPTWYARHLLGPPSSSWRAAPGPPRPMRPPRPRAPPSGGSIYHESRLPVQVTRSSPMLTLARTSTPTGERSASL